MTDLDKLYIPKYDTSDWRVGFEVEMLFGDLGLKKYRRVIEEEGGFDIASIPFCKDIAARLSKQTGEKWSATDEPSGNGFFVMPERDLDPYDFTDGAVGGVELITPPLLMHEAEEMRLNIIQAIDDIENGFVHHCDPSKAGWHVNVDKGDNRDIEPSTICAGLWEGRDSEIDLLLSTERYGNGSRYTAPQHHGYGPALMLALVSPPFSLTRDSLSSFLYHHCGRSKRFATNLGKLEQGYIEYRHLGLTQFFEEEVSIASYLDTQLRAMTIGFSNSQPFYDRLFDRFTLLGEWLNPLQSRFTCRTRDRQRGQEGQYLFDGEVVARTLWDGIGELRFGSDEDELRDPTNNNLNDRVFPTLTTGLDADELLAGVAILAMDTLYFERCDAKGPSLPKAFDEAVMNLKERFDAEGMIGNDMTEKGAKK